MAARDAFEAHRTATPLELFFDLCFVVAVALAASELHHAIVEGHVRDGVISFLLVFFGTWWAWVNFTWFASAYDTDDVLYRIATFVQMTGVLILAAGIPDVYRETDFTITVVGYVVMRLALVPQWLRAAHADPERRTTAQRYAIAIALIQFGWVGLLFVPEDLRIPAFLTFAPLELLIPIWAESAERTTWHHEHLAERHSLFTIIVLGEAILASTLAMQAALEAGHDKLDLLLLAGAGLITVFSMWWLYFDTPPPEPDHTSMRSFAWGYNHVFVFASIAAMGAGLNVAIEREAGLAAVSDQTAGFAIAAPVAIYLLALCVIDVMDRRIEASDLALPVGAVLALASAAAGLPIHLIALVIMLVAIVKAVVARSGA